jgi:hypothetical protein
MSPSMCRSVCIPSEHILVLFRLRVIESYSSGERNVCMVQKP